MCILGRLSGSVLARAVAVRGAAAAGGGGRSEGLAWTLGGARGFRSAAVAMAPIKVTAGPVRPGLTPLPLAASLQPSVPLRPRPRPPTLGPSFPAGTALRRPRGSRASVPRPLNKPTFLASFKGFVLHLPRLPPRLSRLLFRIHCDTCDGGATLSRRWNTMAAPTSGPSFAPGSPFSPQHPAVPSARFYQAVIGPPPPPSSETLSLRACHASPIPPPTANAHALAQRASHAEPAL